MYNSLPFKKFPNKLLKMTPFIKLQEFKTIMTTIMKIIKMIIIIMTVTSGLITMKMVVEKILTMPNLLMKLPLLTSLVLDTLHQFMMTTMMIHTMNTWRQHMKKQLRT